MNESTDSGILQELIEIFDIEDISDWEDPSKDRINETIYYNDPDRGDEEDNAFMVVKGHYIIENNHVYIKLTNFDDDDNSDDEEMVEVTHLPNMDVVEKYIVSHLRSDTPFPNSSRT